MTTPWERKTCYTLVTLLTCWRFIIGAAIAPPQMGRSLTVCFGYHPSLQHDECREVSVLLLHVLAFAPFMLYVFLSVFCQHEYNLLTFPGR